MQDSSASSSSHRVVPEIEHLLPSQVSDLGSHTVSVTPIDDLASLGQKQQEQLVRLVVRM